MVSHLFYYQLALLAIVWLFIMLHLTGSTPAVPAAAAPALTEPSNPSASAPTSLNPSRASPKSLIVPCVNETRPSPIAASGATRPHAPDELTPA
jgi:hypothetical protein